jgi:hypothetical protein
MISIRRHLSYANVVATLALVFAMSGGALAASHYLINSTKQINPKVLKKLTGKTGAAGATGATGAPGATGPAGPKGAQGVPGIQGEEGFEGEPGTARAYGGVTATGETDQLDPSVPWKGFYPPSVSPYAVLSPQTGVYCIGPVVPALEKLGVTPSSTLIVATVSSTTNGAVAVARNGTGNCPGKWEVDTFVAGVATAEPFNFVIP